MLDQYLFIMQ